MKVKNVGKYRHRNIILILLPILVLQLAIAKDTIYANKEVLMDNFASSGLFSTTAYTKPDQKFHLSSRELFFISANYPIVENIELSFHTLLPPIITDGMIGHAMMKTTIGNNTDKITYAILLNCVFTTGEIDLERPILGGGGVITFGDFNDNFSVLAGAGSNLDGEMIQLVNFSGQIRVTRKLKFLSELIMFSTSEEPFNSDTIFIGLGLRYFWNNTCLDFGLGRGLWDIEDVIGIPYLRISVNI